MEDQDTQALGHKQIDKDKVNWTQYELNDELA